MAHIHHARMGDADMQVLSFLDEAQAHAAGFPMEAVIGTTPDGTEVGPETLAVNDLFVAYLHATIADRGPSVPTLALAGVKQQTGYLYVLDLRTPEGTDIPIEDVIGLFEVQEGRIRPEGYRANAAWRPISAHGTFRFPSWLTDLLRLQLPAANT